MSLGSIYHAIRANRLFQRLTRVLQFLSAIISLGLFSARLAKIIRLTRHASTSNGAVEGILAAAALYTLIVMILTFLLKRGAPTFVRWLLIAMDLLFLGAFIAVAVLTRSGSSGACKRSRFQAVIPKGQNCKLPWGTFGLAIISTLLHFLTAVFHEVKDHHQSKHYTESEMSSANGNGTRHQGNGHGNGNGHYGQTVGANGLPTDTV